LTLVESIIQSPDKDRQIYLILFKEMNVK
jgi:hypothetical protein